MNSIQLLERLIQRLPWIACSTKTAAAFWQKVDGAMELVWDSVKTEAERTETEVRYGDLVELANRLGMPQPDDALAARDQNWTVPPDVAVDRLVTDPEFVQSPQIS